MMLSPVVVCYGEENSEKPFIDIHDYFQLPADMVNNFPLIHSGENHPRIIHHLVKDENL